MSSAHQLEKALKSLDGILLGADLLAWMSTARASLDIDQYIYHECGDEQDDAIP
ncbi:hypothetical protein OHU45_06710 [Streptomyces tubercidicus]|uniref:hypothetical protein n=1 Tax=Streptomyces tubercidicus TaxID=47759 RepID=UPI002E14FFC8|nr:hypothetical protein OG761_06500 [Streptomyces tubercidicus]WSX25485.1 hypothetical protein OG690_30780 [Streptomyces tubercidicus]